ncbi:MAG: putative ABC transporter permease subunit [Thermoguttaceae bacterium]
MRAATSPSPTRLPSLEAESRGFLRLEWRILRTQVAQGLAASRLRYALVIVLSLLLWFGLFHLVREGFHFMKGTLPLRIHEQVVRVIFNAFFFALFLMLIFSSGVILYGSLFRSGEVAYLLTMPIHEERIFQHKFQHAVTLSSWGFVLLGSPMLVAYGNVALAPWYYYAMVLPMLVAFVVIPAGIGAILLLAVMRFFPRKRGHLLALGIALLIGATVWFFWSLFSRPESDLLTPRWFLEMLQRLQLAQEKPLPNWWLSSGLLEAAGHAWSESVMFLAILIANALFFRELAGMFAARIYRKAYWEAAGAGSSPTRVQMGWFDRTLNRCLGFLSPSVRLILMKDVRLFRRDPLQWSQFLILTCLLLMYFTNVHPVTYTLRLSQWVNVVSFMNLSVVGLLMSTFTTRFVFPLVSLEGHRFWLLGLLPLKRDSILWAKFLFSVGCLLVPCGLLILLSDWRLGIPLMLMVQHQGTSLLLCLGLSGIGVGMGARLPVINEQSPSRIAAGFGGTLNLVIGTLFIVLILALATLPCHVYLARQIEPTFSFSGEFTHWQIAIRSWLIVGSLASLIVGVLAALAPMWIGIRTFRRQEFH